MGNASLIWGVLFLPLIGFLVQACFGGSIVKSGNDSAGKRVSGILAVLFIAVPFILGLIITKDLASLPADARFHVVTLFDWIKIQSLTIPFEVRIDTLSMTMVLIVTGLGSLIHLFATGYMAEEKEYTRFFTYLNLFIAFMLMLVLGNNLALLFIGWEGVGLCSYLLIGFWYKDLNNARAANKAFIVNRIGDWGLTLGMFAIATLLMTQLQVVPDGRFLSYDVIFSPASLAVFQANPGATTAIALLLFVGAMGKSAQFPLYIWLPDAMAGPTPVSALIHAATMVTSGIVLLNRFASIFAMSPIASAVVACIGGFTALFAALIAFGQRDIKKVLAYSTVSQLGYMFLACGSGAYWAGMFHVTTHAFFKALLFLGSGAVIHAMNHEQDMRWYGNLRKYIPITTVCMIVAWLAISGVPGLSGFFSKEAILGAAFGNELAVVNGFHYGALAGWVALAVAGLTAAYMTRMTMLTFFGGKEQWREIPAEAEHHHEHAHEHAHEDHGPDTHAFFYTDAELAERAVPEEHHHHLDADYTPHEVSPSMWVPLAILAVLSAVGGFVLHNGHLLQHWLFPNGVPLLDAKLVPGEPEHGIMAGHNLMYASIAMAVGGMLLGYIVYRKGMPQREKNTETMLPAQVAAGNQFGYDNMMMDAAVDGGGSIADKFFFKFFDAKLIDGIVNGVGVFARGAGGLLKNIQTGYVRSYALMMLIGVVVIVAYVTSVLVHVGGVK